MLLGMHLHRYSLTTTGLSPSTAPLPNDFAFSCVFLLCNPPADEFEGSHDPNHATPAGYHT